MEIIDTDLSFGFHDATIIASASIPPSCFSQPIHTRRILIFPYASLIIGLPNVSLTISIVLFDKYQRAACVLIIKNCPAYPTPAIQTKIRINIPTFFIQGDDDFFLIDCPTVLLANI